MTSLSKETLDLFDELLGQSSISLGHPDFEAQAQRISLAKREIKAARASVTDESTEKRH